MNTVQVRLGTNNYACTVTDGDHQWVIDEPVDKGGSNTGHDPYAALLASLGSCTAITLKMYAARKGWDLRSVTVDTTLVSDTVADRRTTTFSRSIEVSGRLNEAQLQRLQQIARACPISKILEGSIHIETQIKNGADDHSAGR
jgi:putative redox protein